MDIRKEALNLYELLFRGFLHMLISRYQDSIVNVIEGFLYNFRNNVIEEYLKDNKK